MNKAIFWDFDGTLVYPNESFLFSLCKALSDCGLAIEEAAARRFLAQSCTWKSPEKDYVDKTNELWWDSLLDKVRSFCRQNGADDSAAEKICALFRRNVTNYDYVLYDDAKETLAHFKSLGYRNYLLTNNFPQIIDTAKRFGLDEYFTDYFVSACVGYEKPRAELFRYALGKAGTPDVCYMVGDNPVADIIGAQNVGITTILVHRQCESSADYICAELRELKGIIGI